MVSVGLAGGAAPAGAQTLADIVRAARAPADGLFGTKEITHSSLGALPQWREIVGRMKSETAAFSRCGADKGECKSAAERSWHELYQAAARLGRLDKLHAVNRFFNRWPYKTDRELYNRAEVWAAPRDFMLRSGDCEDFAIAKFFALRQLGFSNAELRIVVLYDRIRAMGHAVLAVYEPNDILILDSLSNFIGPHTRYRHYIPQYSMNETTRWAHIDPNRAIPETAFRTTQD